MSSLITLTTDFTSGEPDVAVLKGRILRRAPDAQFIDVNHDIPLKNTLAAAYHLRKILNEFPAGTIHVVDVDAEPVPDKIFLVAFQKGEWIVTADNGIIWLALNDFPEKLFSFMFQMQPGVSDDPVSEIGGRLAAGELPESFLSPSTKLKQSILQNPIPGPDFIRGNVIYIDGLGNTITNIDRELFERVRSGRKFLLHIRHDLSTGRINHFYEETKPGNMLCRFNKIGLLEIAINSGNAAKLIGLSSGGNIQVEFIGG